MMKILAFILVIILAFLQYALWFSKNGVRQNITLKQAIHAQQQQNSQLAEQNQKLVIEINNLKHGHEAIEEHARNDLGMIKFDEIFYQVVNSQSH